MKRTFHSTLILAAVALLAVAQTVEAGKLRRLLYLDYPGTWVTNLFTTNTSGTVSFPDAPTLADYMPPGSPGMVLPPYWAVTATNTGDTYGGLIQGYLTAPETGDYIFWLASDDEGQFFMTTDPADPLNPAKTNLICRVPGNSTTARDWTRYPEQQSAPVSLQKGKTYYVEIRHKEGTGSDFVVLGWQTPNGVLELPMPAWHFQPIKNTNTLWLEPDLEVVAGPVNPATPGDTVVYDGNLAVVYVNVNLDQPVTYQWQTNGVNLPGATNAYYLFRANVPDGSLSWRVIANSGGTPYTSDPIGLTVSQNAPEVLGVSIAPQNSTVVQVVFSEDVSPATATNTARYTLTGATVQSATLEADGRTVTLRTSLLSPPNVHTLTVNGIQDMATPPNAMASAFSTNLVVAEGSISFRYWDRPFAVDIASLRLWSSNTPAAPSYVTNGFNEERTIYTSSYPWNLSPTRDNYMGQMIGYLTPPETGYYKFAIASDDHSILYLGTTDQRSSKREICNYNGSTGRWNTGAQVANQQSAMIYLEAGKRYYFEAVYRDGTGSDGVSVFWHTPSGPSLPTVNASVQADTEPFLIPASCLSTFAAPSVAGGLTFRIWYSSFAANLGELRAWSTDGNSTYVNELFAEERTITATSYQWNLVPMMDNYEGQMIGYVTAPETGNYRFAIASDDNSILYLGTTDQRSSKREICSTNGSSGRWNINPASTAVSADIPLVAGRRYYIEAVYRDGTGGDGVTVAWYTPKMATDFWAWPPANSQAAVTPYLIPAQYLSPFNAFGNVTLQTNLPASFTVAESSAPVLTALVDGTQPYGYQWFRNGAPVAGATTSSYAVPYVRPADIGSTFQVIVTNNFSSVTSALATLTGVTADTTKPAVVSVGSLFKQKVEVRLTEPVSDPSVANTANYILTGSSGATVAVNSVTVDTNDAAHLTLQTAPLPETDLMQLAVVNLTDRSPAANVIDPATNTFRANNFDGLERINNAQPYSAEAVGDVIRMTAGGSDIWGVADQCAFLYKTVTGNFDYKVQGVSLPTVNQWCKMGPMARASLAADARNSFNSWTPVTPAQNTYTAQVRTNTGTSTSSSNDGVSELNARVRGGVAARPTLLPYPSWLRLQRIGNTIYYYYGSTGTNWTFWTSYDSTASSEGALPATLQLGLALTSHDTARTVEGVMASFMAVNDGPLRLTLEPRAALMVEGSSTNLFAGAAGSTPISYQWLTNGTTIADATNATLALNRVPFAFNGLRFACRVSNPYGQVLTTSNALLTVTKDAAPPTVRYYTVPKININPTEVKLLFSEPMDPNTAQNTAYYQITPIAGGTPLSVFSALLDVDERTVILTTDTQTPGTTYKVVVNNVLDLACCPPNPVAPNSTDYFFYAGAAPQYKQRADGYIVMETENAQENIIASDGDEFVRTNYYTGYSGLGYTVVPNGRSTGGTAGTSPQFYGTGAKLVFHVNFINVGRHIIWVRGWNETTSGNDDSIYVGFNNDVGVSDPANDWMVGMTTDVNQSQLSGFPTTGWQWRSDRNAGSDPLTFTNTAAGLHRFIIWQREDGTHIDKVVIESGNRAAGNTAAPAAATNYAGLGDPETWDFIVQPPGGPSISITSPANGQTFPGNGTIPITTTTSGPSPVVLVEFFEGTNVIGTATAAPFSMDWDSVPEGIHSLTARVTDGLGNQATSAAVQVIVDSSKPVAYAAGSIGGSGIGVYFADLSGVDAVTATAINNYKVNGGAIAVTSATLEPDSLAVMLELGAPVSGPFSVEVKNVADRGFGPNVMEPVTLQGTVVVPWLQNQDIGTTNAAPPPLFTDPVMPGFVQAIGTDGFYVHAGGSDIWSANDGMHFVYRPVTGDFDVAVRVDRMSRPSDWSKAGLMVREDLDPNSRNFLIAATPTNGQNRITVQWRPGKNAASASQNALSPSPVPNAWLRMARSNQVFSFYWSSNGTAWVSYYATNLTAAPYPENTYVGLATTSHSNGTNLSNTVSAYFRDFTGLQPMEQPKLTISVSGSDAVISWTSSDSTLQLQYTDNLAPVNWQAVGTSPVPNGNGYTVTVPLTAQPRYFRLLKP